MRPTSPEDRPPPASLKGTYDFTRSTDDRIVKEADFRRTPDATGRSDSPWGWLRPLCLGDGFRLVASGSPVGQSLAARVIIPTSAAKSNTPSGKIPRTF